MTELPNVLAGYATEKELAKQLDRSDRTLRRWRQQPDGPPYTRLGNQEVIYNLDKFRHWFASKERTPNPRRAA